MLVSRKDHMIRDLNLFMKGADQAQNEFDDMARQVEAFNANDKDDFMAALDAAIPFVFANTPDHADTGIELEVACLSPLPFKFTLLEVPTGHEPLLRMYNKQAWASMMDHYFTKINFHGFLVRDEKELRAIWPITHADIKAKADPRVGTRWVEHGAMYVIDRTTGDVIHSTFLDSDGVTDGETAKKTVAMVSGAILSLHADGMISVPHEGVRRNKAKARKMGLPFKGPDFNIVKIDPNAKRYIGTDEGSHASPHIHWRRAHLRTLADGRKVPVRRCIVGVTGELRDNIYHIN